MPHLTLSTLLVLSIFLRVTFFFYGLYQDAHSALKFTDIDYFVFTDASRALSHGQSPYTRETYRYTPLLAWALYPTVYFFSFGKLIFAASDVIAGWGIVRILRSQGRDGIWVTAGCWLLNPMVATISTRGSSEGLLGAVVIGMLYATLRHRWALAGVALGVATHLKIYPVIYAPAIILWMSPDDFSSPTRFLCGLFTKERLVFAVSATTSFITLNIGMYAIYGQDFIQHTFLHHISRLDHRHNFSPYNILLYLVSSPTGTSEIPFATYAFLPQMVLSAVLLPLATAKKNLPGCLFLQTFAFVAFNKVCTSQYFMWYLVLLPFVLPGSEFSRVPWKGVVGAVGWVGVQAVWLGFGFQLEFLGTSSFFPGLWVASLAMLAVNCWILGESVVDIAGREQLEKLDSGREKGKVGKVQNG